MDTSFKSHAMTPIPLSEPEIRGNEWVYVKECLDSGWVSSAGTFVDRFERNLSALVESNHAVATSSGTAALHLALLVAGVQADEEVIVPSLTFIAPANAVRYVGAYPVFVDIESKYWQLDVEKVGDFIAKECAWRDGCLWNRQTGRRVSAVIPVHVLGHPTDLDPLCGLAAQYHLKVIEDASESLGSRYRQRPTGSIGHIGCFSFNGNKIVTTGGGGMMVTNDSNWAERARYLSTQAKDDPVRYRHEQVGYNYRLSNIQAAVGCAQLERLESFVERKRKIAAMFNEKLREIDGLRTPQEAEWAFSNSWLYSILLDPSHGWDVEGVMQDLNKSGVQCRPLWQPLHLSNAHAGCQSYHCTTSQMVASCALSLPSSVGLKEEHIDFISHRLASYRRYCQNSLGAARHR